MSYVGLYQDEGSKNAFYIVKDKKIERRRVGFKEFENEKEAKFAHRIQKRLAQHDLAPMVYGDVGMIRIHTGEFTCCGYLTEVARPMSICNDVDCECFQENCSNSITINAVVEELREQGLDYNDAHKGNFGFVRRKGRWVPVVIDLGIESFTEWDESIYGEFDYDENDCFSNSSEYGMCTCTACKNLRKEHDE